MTGRLHSLKARIGGQVNGARGVFPGPAHSRHDRSLSLWDLGDRVLAYSFAGDDYEEVASYLSAHGIELATRATLTPVEKRRFNALMKKAREEEAVENERKRRIALSLWERAQPLGLAAEAYLHGRGIPDAVIEEARLADGLRFAPEAPLSPYAPGQRTQPAMLGLVVDRYGAALGLHMTFIKRDGSSKAGDKPRLMLGRQAGGMIRLTRGASADGALAVAEGIETALAYSALTGMPCWAARSATGLEQFRPPDGVRRVVIAADSDAAGMAAADALCVSLRAYLDCEIHAAPAGRDWNDALRESAAAEREADA